MLMTSIINELNVVFSELRDFIFQMKKKIFSSLYNINYIVSGDTNTVMLLTPTT